VIPTNEELAIARDTLEVLEKMADEAKTALSQEAIDKELATVGLEERRELVLLWAADPEASPEVLLERFSFKLGKKISLVALRHELGRLGILPAIQDGSGPDAPAEG
jgi:hypothetical protein